jgi:hypothetical protein
MDLDRKLLKESRDLFTENSLRLVSAFCRRTTPLTFIQRLRHYNRRADSVRGNGIWQADDTGKAYHHSSTSRSCTEMFRVIPPNVLVNGDIGPSEVQKFCQLDKEGLAMIRSEH